MTLKSIFKRAVAALCGYAMAELALWAEYGTQHMVPGYKANSAYNTLGATKYVFMMATAANAANLATNATSSTLLGVLQNDPLVGGAMTIAYAGLSKVVAGGALTAGNIITTNSSGRAAAVASGQMAAGRVLETAGADGDVVTAMLFHPVRWTGAA